MEIKKFIKPEYLIDNAAFTEDQEVRHDFTEDEIIELKDQIFKLSNKLDLREVALKTFKDVMNKDYDDSMIEEALLAIKKRKYGEMGIKTLKSEFKQTLQRINAGYEIVKKTLYAFEYHDITRIAFYDEEGNYEWDRPMNASEKQLTITAEMRKIS